MPETGGSEFRAAGGGVAGSCESSVWKRFTIACPVIWQSAAESIAQGASELEVVSWQ